MGIFTEIPDEYVRRDELAQFSIAKLEMEPGDILVLRVTDLNKAPDVSGFARALGEMTPYHNRVVVLTEGAHLEVIKKADAP